MIAAFLIVTPYHNAMIILSSTLALISMFYITFYVFKSGLYYLKLLSIVCLLISYFCNYIYYTKHYLEFLPIVQKLALGITVIWMLGLEYFTGNEDFENI